MSADDDGHGDGPGGGQAGPDPALAALAPRLPALFRLRSEEAPGLHFFGGMADPARIRPSDDPVAPASLSGSGPTSAEAFNACVGEAAEYLSQVAWGDETLHPGPAGRSDTGLTEEEAADVHALLRPSSAVEGGDVGWIEAVSLCGRPSVLLPADLCLRRGERRRRLSPVVPLSAGCAAGPSRAAAIAHAVLELIERDAAAQWWIGGRRGRGISVEMLAATGATALIVGLRRESGMRRTTLLDITGDLGVPSVAALSFDGDGSGMACGLAARLSLGAAIRAAVLEMCQMELSRRLARLKLERDGEARLTRREADLLRLGRSLTADDCALLQPVGLGAPDPAAVAPTDDEALGRLAERLRERRLDAFVVDLTRPWLGIAAARVVIPGLQPMDDAVTTARLRATVAETGGALACTRGIPLL